MRWGAEGYGIYFMILERLREEPEYMSIKDYNMIAFDLRVDTGKVKSVIEDFGLFVFTEDGKYFYSESFRRRMLQKDEKSKKLSEAGKMGNLKRWNKYNSSIATQSPPDRICNKNSSQEKERKEKERKGNHLPPLSPTWEIFDEIRQDIPSEFSSKRKEKDSAGKEKIPLKFPYTSEKFMSAWNQLILCPKWKKKIQYTLQLALNQLAKFEEDFAIQLIEAAAANNWQGVVFPDTEEKYQRWIMVRQQKSIRSSSGAKESKFAQIKNNVERNLISHEQSCENII